MTRPSRTGGKTSAAKARNASPAKGRKSTKTKRRIAPAATRVKRRSASGPSIDLKEAREQQAATAEILKVIASSPDDVQPVFEAIVANADRLIGGFSTGVYRFVDGICHLEAFTPINPAADETMRARFPRPIAGMWHFERAHAGEIVEFADTETEAAALPLREIARARGFRSLLYVPLMSKGAAIGFIAVSRRNPGSFSAHHVELLQTFADQAVIAIENARLFNEAQEALERQTATADILKVIASSPSDVQPVFEAIVGSAAKLFEPCSATITTLKDDKLCWNATAASISGFDVDRVRTIYPIPFDRDRVPSARAILERRIIEIPDVAVPGTPEFTRKAAAAGGFRSITYVPLVDREQGIGTIIFSHPQTGFRFSDKQLALLQTFADQAVIAIENARLFNETREALERQTATADILKVIASSPNDAQPVFEAIVANADRLIGGFSAGVYRFVGAICHVEAFTPVNPAADEKLKALFPRPVADVEYLRRARAGEVVAVADTEAEPDVLLMEIARTRGFRSLLYAPLMSKGMAIGVINVTRRNPGPFSAHHVELLRTFADQAVIAIENVRLFDEVQARTRDLTEALTYQTGSANILKVIASSPTDVGPVLNAIVESACELCEANDAVVLLKAGNDLRFSAHHGPIHIDVERWPINRNWIGGRAFLDQKPVHVRDLLSDEGSEYPDAMELSLRTDSHGIRSILGVPLLRDDESIGTILLRRTEVNPFSEKQIALLQTFADQAVIAIGNVRLFEEVQARTRDLSESLQQQTATADVLKVISRSTFDLQTVLSTLLGSAARLCGADLANIWRPTGGAAFQMAASFGVPGKDHEWLENKKYLEGLGLKPGRGSIVGRTLLEVAAVQVQDIQADPEYELNEIVRIGDYRTMLGVPLMREGIPVGVFVLTRCRVERFTDKQIELVSSFADQAVIAIENVRLFDEVGQRTRELSRSLDELRTAQDRLVQTEKLASLGQLTAGIAHEIKNPLNFVNNFSALSAELTEELNEILKSAALGEKMREEVDELTGLLKDNLKKVVQHGKRADSIVKNMLLHSREGSGEHRLADINVLVDESLNLAYHGARAEKPSFNVTMQRSFDPAVGTADVYPQEITRVLLNLISNGFYAAAKRKTDAGDDFEPTLTATTKDLGDNIEIRIRDNGIGVPDEVKVKIFNPFFTTKPAGEGTGLGLSMSHDIIVKQHGGKIDVETEPGQFTEFRIVLPRTAATGKAGADK